MALWSIQPLPEDKGPPPRTAICEPIVCKTGFEPGVPVPAEVRENILHPEETQDRLDLEPAPILAQVRTTVTTHTVLSRAILPCQNTFVPLLMFITLFWM
jgi:hypothetical protein